MKNFKKWIAGAIGLSVLSFTTTSCLKDAKQQALAVGDVFIQDMKTDAGIKYGLIIYVTSNTEIVSGKVTAPGTNGKVYQLSAGADKFQYVYYTPAAEYTSELPVKGDYSMEISLTNGESLYGKDALGEEKLLPISIKTTSFDAHVLKTTWDKVTSADAYIIRLYDANKTKVIFSSTYLTDVTQYEFSASSAGWGVGVTPVINTNYVVELVAVRVETGMTTDKGNNIQFSTVDSKTIKWE